MEKKIKNKEVGVKKSLKGKMVMVKRLNLKAREELRLWLLKHTKCAIQDGMVNSKKKECSWPCGTCVINLLNTIGLDSKKKEYKTVNATHDRHNEVWRAILQIRDAE